MRAAIVAASLALAGCAGLADLEPTRLEGTAQIGTSTVLGARVTYERPRKVVAGVGTLSSTPQEATIAPVATRLEVLVRAAEARYRDGRIDYATVALCRDAAAQARLQLALAYSAEDPASAQAAIAAAGFAVDAIEIALRP